MKETILCMFSGGLDSTAVLYKLLTEKEYYGYNIHVHHMHLRNVENRAIAEANAIRKMFDYFEKNNLDTFSFTENNIETLFLRKPRFESFQMDSDVMAFYAASICIGDPSITKIFIGHTKTDIELADNLIVRRERMQKILEACYFPDKTNLKFTSPLLNLTKKEVYDILPMELRDLTWSCRRPTYDDAGNAIACGHCLTCNEIGEIHNE